MLTISKNNMPKLWWLNPWSIAKSLYKAVIAMQQCIQDREVCIARKDKEIHMLNSRVKDVSLKLIKTNAKRKHKRRTR